MTPEVRYERLKASMFSVVLNQDNSYDARDKAYIEAFRDAEEQGRKQERERRHKVAEAATGFVANLIKDFVDDDQEHVMDRLSAILAAAAATKPRDGECDEEACSDPTMPLGELTKTMLGSNSPNTTSEKSSRTTPIEEGETK